MPFSLTSELPVLTRAPTCCGTCSERDSTSVLTECFVCSLKAVHMSCVGVSMKTSSIYGTITWVCPECHETGKPERKTDEMADQLCSIEKKPNLSAH